MNWVRDWRNPKFFTNMNSPNVVKNTEKRTNECSTDSRDSLTKLWLLAQRKAKRNPVWLQLWVTEHSKFQQKAVMKIRSANSKGKSKSRRSLLRNLKITESFDILTIIWVCQNICSINNNKYCLKSIPFTLWLKQQAFLEKPLQKLINLINLRKKEC